MLAVAFISIIVIIIIVFFLQSSNNNDSGVGNTQIRLLLNRCLCQESAPKESVGSTQNDASKRPA